MAVGAALNIERSVIGQPWRWRRPPDDSLGMDALVDELLLARGVAREDLVRHREPRIRDFLPDPSCFQDMDKGAKRLADAVQSGETIAIFGDYDVDGATSAALRGESGVVGQDEERGDELRAIEFERIKGGKKFDVSAPWFAGLLRELGQA